MASAVVASQPAKLPLAPILSQKPGISSKFGGSSKALLLESDKKKEAIEKAKRISQRARPDKFVKTEVDNFAEAALLLFEADHLLIAAGAGFSADSGLPVYKDIANVEAYHRMGLTYADLCDPVWIRRDPEIFYGFWGRCINDYLNTEPHEGYLILKRWVDTIFCPPSAEETIPSLRPSIPLSRSRSLGTLINHTSQRPTTTAPGLSRRGTSTAMMSQLGIGGVSNNKPVTAHKGVRRRRRSHFVYTSNVDTMFERCGFDRCKIFEIHGNVMDWQCASGCGATRWTLPPTRRFTVGDDMRAPRMRRVPVQECAREENRDAVGQKEGAGGSEKEYVSGGGVRAVRTLHKGAGGLSCYNNNNNIFNNNYSNYDGCSDDGDGDSGNDVEGGGQIEMSDRMEMNHVRCRGCSRPARPNVLMFDDDDWEAPEEPPRAYKEWQNAVQPSRMVILEGGCGKRVPTVRMNSNSLVRKGASIIRINTLSGHATTPAPTFGAKAVSLECGVLHALKSIDAILQRMVLAHTAR